MAVNRAIEMDRYHMCVIDREYDLCVSFRALLHTPTTHIHTQIHTHTHTYIYTDQTYNKLFAPSMWAGRMWRI